jgi:flavin reductase (DIM6/NTAB) family NADH-FMN oxidoreductase RutF
MLFLSISLQGANVNVTTFYSKTGGIVGVLNTTSQVVNGRTICPANPTVGCDFDDNPLFSNNGTTNDPSDDTYSGDLLVRTNDSFQITAGWLWNGEAGGSKEKVIIKGTLPSIGILPDGSTGETKSYKWDTLPGVCDADESNISEDKQVMYCVRKNFDANDVGTYSEDLPFNVIVKGETLSRTQPGDVTFEISAEDATTVSDDTDGYSLEVTSAPRWNLQKWYYTVISKQEVDGVNGWIMDYKFYIEVDEVSGEVDNASALVGNESMGKSATFTFTDDLSAVSPNAKLVDCSMNGRYTNRDGHTGGGDPRTYSWDGYPERSIPQAKGEQQITCTQTGSSIAVEVSNVDATLSFYPTRDWNGNALPVNRGIAAIGNIYVFVPASDVQDGEDGIRGTADDNELQTTNALINFDPVTPSGNQNFGGERESEKDNNVSYTLYYTSKGSFDKYYRGDKSGMWSYVGGANTSRSGFAMGTKGYEFSSILILNNHTGVTPFSESKACDVVDAYRLEIQDIGDNTHYETIKTYYADAYRDSESPVVYRVWGGNTDYANNLAEGPYVIEYASTYEDDSWLPSRGGDNTVSHASEIITECSADASKWFSTADEARADANGIGAVTKVRMTLRSGIEHPDNSYTYFWINHKIRSHDLQTGSPLEHGDEIANYSAWSFNGNAWSGSSYTPDYFPNPHAGTAGDRIIYTGPKARIIKDADKVALSVADIVTFNLKLSFTNDTGIDEYGNVKVTDLLPKGLTYIAQSVSEPYAEPVMGTCADVVDLNSTSTPCVDGENQVLIWDLGERRAGDVFPDINYSTIVGVAVNDGAIRNVVKIEAPTDASAISQRKADIGMSVTIPASINIVKSTVENVNYPSLRERTTTEKEIDFVMNMRNGKAGDITDLDVIDILPFYGDADDQAIQFNDLALKRKVATNYHGTSVFKSTELIAHPLSSSVCDITANGGVKYYYTNEDPKTVNIAPTVGDANVIGGPSTIWCEGDENGPNGCNGLDNASVTAVRARGPRMKGQAICQFKVSLTVKDNLAGDNYSNSAGASATGVTLPVLSNSLSVPIFGSSLGDYVWYDKNANGVQDGDENGIEGVTVKLLTTGGTPVKNPSSPSDDYVVTTDVDGKYSFEKLNSGNYVVEFVKPTGFLISNAGNGTSATDSDITDTANSRTGTIVLGIDFVNNDVDAGFYTPIISGNVFNDGNSDGTVNGTAISSLDGTQLYVTLLDSSNSVLASKAVAVDGTYSFDGEDNVSADSNYTIVLSTTQGATASILAVNWNSADGEHIGTGVGLDDRADGKIAVNVAQSDVEEINFGVNKKPVANDVSEAIQFNPGASIKVDIPDINVSDNEDSTPTTVTIVSWTNNGQPYYNGVAVTVGQVIPNFDNSLFTLDPDAGDQTVNIVYNTTDKVGVISDDASITMPFKDLKISGNLYIDGNGNGKIDGTTTSSADGTQLYVTLVNGGVAVASKPLSTGSYEFGIEDGLSPNTNYTIILSESNGSTIASLPAEWSNEDGEKVGLTGTDGSNDGELAVNVVTSNIINANFGINKKPVAEDVTEPAQVNPGTTSTVNVPDLNISDEETTSGLTVTITTLPNNATLYYNGIAVTANQNITNFDNSLLTIDPNDGSQNVSFNYTTTDGAGTESDEATVSMSFKDISIAGTVYVDGNGNGNVDGNGTDNADGNTLYVSLLDSMGVEVSSKALDANGTYYFDTLDGLSPDSNYSIVLTKVHHGLSPSLPNKWNNADGENIGLVGLDGSADGQIEVEVLKASITEINFGINKQPVANNVSEASQINPGLNSQVNVPDLNVSDNEDGIPTTITITELPSNAILYYDGVEVTVNTPLTNFDANKFTVDPNNGDLTITFKYTTTDRVGVVSDEAIVTMPFVGLEISGHVFNDGNNDGTINGTGISAPNGVQLYVTLLDANGTALASHPVNGDGTYLFGGDDGIISDSNYTIVLTSSENNTTAGLPTNWNNEDGEHIGTDAGTDGSNDGQINVSVETSNVIEVNFGINKQPLANDVTEPLQLNPGTETQVDVPNLVVSDNEDSTPSTVTITTLPVNGTLYYDGAVVTAGQTFNDFNNSLLTVDPENGDVTVSFTYTTTDAVGVVSEEATVSMSFDGLEISGNIFNDGNSDGTVNGTKISQIESTALYATLLDDNGTVLGSRAIESDGSYTFTGLDGIIPNSDYAVIVSIEANTTSSTLLSNWNSADGEHIGTAVGLDGNADGKIVVAVTTTDVEEVNFGLNKQPIANDVSAPVQINPGAEKEVTVPLLSISDNEDTTPSVVTITTLPTNAILYYNGAEVTVDMNITDVNLSKFTVNPEDGDVTVVFNYTTTDSVGVVSEPATVTMPFIGLKISGNIFNDGNNDGTINGTGIVAPNGVQLYVTLLDANGTALASHPVNGDGTYLFGGSDGIVSHSNYTVILTISENNTTATLPINWNNEDGEHIGTDAGSDGNNDGKIIVNIASTNIEEVNFGINQQPIANDITEPLQLNPGTETQVDVPNLVVSDNEDSTPSRVTIVNLPINGTLYYNGTAITAGQTFNDFNNTLLTVDPENGDVTISFTYTTTDAVGVVSEEATVNMSFDGLEISGNIFNDGNNDGTVNGTKIAQIESTALYVTLLDGNGTLLGTTAIKSDGSYKFIGLDGIIPNSDYEVVVSIEANATTSTLLSNWNSADGEHIGTGVGLDGNADGKIVVNVETKDVPEVNFGLNKQPIANDVSEPVQINLGADKQVLVADLNVSDNEDAVPTTITITDLPNNALIYYDGVVVTANTPLTDFNASKLTVDPNDGDVTVIFNYTTTDSVGVISEPATVTMPFVGLEISGNVFNDGNNDGTINGTAIAGPSGVQLYVTLVDTNGSVKASHEVNSDGTYLFSGTDGIVSNSNYRVILTTSENNTTASLPTNWNNEDGEHIGTDAGTDGSNDGQINVNVETSNVLEVNFGINKQPLANDVTEPLQLNPGTETQVDVPNLVVSDNEDSTPSRVTIVNLPINGTLYYNGTAVTAGQTFNDFNNTLLTVDPENGDVTVSFTYTTTDAVGVVSEEATVNMSFEGLEIAGNVFNDGNNDGTVNGSKISEIESMPLYATLLDGNGTVLGTTAIKSDGSYKFTGLDGIIPNSDYEVVVSIEANTTSSTLLSNWNSADGEHIGTAVGLDGNADGKIVVNVETEDVEEVNFGLNKQPRAEDKTEILQINPGADKQVQVPALEISDNEDATPSILTIMTLPTNGTLYYNGTEVTEEMNITDANLSGFTVNPNDGDLTVTFNYTTTDSVGVVSDVATVTMPLVGLEILGNVFNDGNNDGTINGAGISAPNGIQLYVTLLDANGTTVASYEVNGDGSYLFGGSDGIVSNSNYTVILTSSENNTTATLPTNWNNEDGEHIGTDVGTDGNNDGKIDVTVETTNVEEVNFGINKKPVANDVTEPLQLNPGKETQVNAPNLVVNDNEDSTPSTVTIINLPVNGTLYYNGTAVIVGQTFNDFNNILLTIDPENGDVTISFTYTTTDAVGVVSEEATVNMSFEGLEISGNVFNDGNNDGRVNGTKISQIEGTLLYATLLETGGTVLGSTAIKSDGSYKFTGLDGVIPNSDYEVIVSIEANATTSTLLSNWNSADGEHIGTGVGLDGNADGKIMVAVTTEDVSEVNFGVNKQPKAKDKTEILQINPGANKHVKVPNLNVTDHEDSVPTTITVTELPSNGVLYYDGVEVSVNTPLTNFDANKFTVDPNNGDLTVTFKYTTTDRAGVASDDATVTMPFVGLKISGNVFNDGDNDGTVNGTGISAPNGVQLYVSLVDEDGTAVASHEVNGDGSYLFGGSDGIVSNSNYTVILTSTQNNTTATLPTNWNNEDGEHIGTGAGTDGSNDGKIRVNIASTDIEEVNFGINKQPVANDVTGSLQLNPGKETQVNVANLVLSDNEDSTPNIVSIVTLPVNGTLYYNGTAVTAGQTLNDFNNTLLTVDPENGDVSISFTYTTTDAVGVVSEEATVNMSFEGLEISGHVFNDGNNDGTVNGTKISQIEGATLYATLLGESANVLGTTVIKSDGSYKFTGLDGIIPNSNYEVIVSIEANATTSTLLSNWNSADGEHIGIGVGLDGNADGKIVVAVTTEDIEEVNFGLNRQPEAEDKIEILQINPGADKQIKVPTLTVSDNEDTTPSTVTITTLPSNAILYHNGQEVKKDISIMDANLSNFTVDPNNGDLTVIFKYTTTDGVGVVSKPATVTMPFYGVTVSGQVYQDGKRDGEVSGLELDTIHNLALYVNLIDANDNIIATVAVEDNGTYHFDASVGLVPDAPYSVRLSKDKNVTSVELPKEWMHMDTTGSHEFTITSHDIKALNFGINKQPVANNVTVPMRINPDSNTTVLVGDLNISMNEDGVTTPTTVTITVLADNGRLYYDNNPVTQGQIIHDFNNTLLMVDPDDANVTVEFSYTSTDQGGFESEPAVVKIPFDDVDTDKDGIPNNIDLDDDNDGILDTVENSTSRNNGDTDKDGIVDRLDLDSDNDGILDLEESTTNPTLVDKDGNGILDSTVDVDKDGVMETADKDDNNPKSEGLVVPIDTDKDNLPDFQDIDSDNDGLADLVEGGTDATLDANTDGRIDNTKDSDGDGIVDLVDSDHGGTPAPTPDTDENGVDNYRDLDSDSDSLLDVIEIAGTDVNSDGQIDPAGTLISGVGLPDENANGIPDVIEIKLQDDERVAAAGETVRIDLLENDSGEIDKSSVELVIPEDFNATARLSPDGKRMLVDGEGEWSVDNNGILTFVPEAGFRGSPTPIAYKATTPDGERTAIAGVSIKVTDVAGATTGEVCDPYEETDVSLYNEFGIIFIILISSIVGWRLVARER